MTRAGRVAGTGEHGAIRGDHWWNWWLDSSETFVGEVEDEVLAYDWFQSHLGEWYGCPQENHLEVRIICLRCGHGLHGIPVGCVCGE